VFAGLAVLPWPGAPGRAALAVVRGRCCGPCLLGRSWSPANSTRSILGNPCQMGSSLSWWLIQWMLACQPQPRHRAGMGEPYNLFTGQSLERLTALTDGVFAVAMTLLALDVRVPASAACAGSPSCCSASGWNGALGTGTPRSCPTRPGRHTAAARTTDAWACVHQFGQVSASEA
jgi:hypothetical protein